MPISSGVSAASSSSASVSAWQAWTSSGPVPWVAGAAAAGTNWLITPNGRAL